MNSDKIFGVFNLIHVLLFLIIAQNLSAMKLQPREQCQLEDSICLINLAQDTLKTFVNGVPKLGIKPIESMKIDYVEVSQNNISYQMWNTVVKGFNNSIIDDISINMDFKVMRILFHSDLVINFDYKADGEVFGFPFFGNGKSEIKMNNWLVEVVISFEIMKNKEGKDFMNLKKFFYGSDAVGGLHYDFENLYDGNKEKSVAVIKLMNTMWRTLVFNYTRFFTVKIIEEVFQAVKIFMGSWPLKI